MKYGRKLTSILIAALTFQIGCVLKIYSNESESGKAVAPDALVEQSERFAVRTNADNFVTVLSVKSDKGDVSWEHILRVMARAKGFDDKALEGVVPDISMAITKRRYRYFFKLLNAALAPSIEITIKAGKLKNGNADLEIKLDRVAMLATKRRFKRRMRNGFKKAISLVLEDEKRYGIQVESDLTKFSTRKNLVVLIHGLHGSSYRFEDFKPAVEKLGLPVAVFDYPNDQPIEDSAKLLAKELAALKKKYPKRSISLVTSSMGGLVARAVVEGKTLDPSNVTQLIMAAPPTHGSSLARFAFALEVWEHIANKDIRNPAKCMYCVIEDGLGEASKDLEPGSVFLTRLNKAPRNPKVRYTLLLGSGGYMSEAAMTNMQKRMRAVTPANRFTRFFGKKLNYYLSDLDELVIGKGDGAVSIARGRLDGVKDTVIVPCDHVSMFAAQEADAKENPKKIILDRLREYSGGKR